MLVAEENIMQNVLFKIGWRTNFVAHMVWVDRSGHMI